ncbi:MAG: hypothetical protein ACFE0P_07965 [Oceanicaulis sp.]
MAAPDGFLHSDGHATIAHAGRFLPGMGCAPLSLRLQRISVFRVQRLGAAMSSDLIAPPAAAEAAEKGLALRREHGRGGTTVGVARARDLKNRRPLSPDTVKRMRSYFRRHAVDKNADGFGDDAQPSAGYIAWLL